MARRKVHAEQAALAFDIGAAPAPALQAAPASLPALAATPGASDFEAIAAARSIAALTAIWKDLGERWGGELFERSGLGLAIRRRALAVLYREDRKKDPRNAGAESKRRLEVSIERGDLPPRPGQVIAPAPPTEEPKAKRSRKSARTAL